MKHRNKRLVKLGKLANISPSITHDEAIYASAILKAFGPVDARLVKVAAALEASSFIRIINNDDS